MSKTPAPPGRAAGTRPGHAVASGPGAVPGRGSSFLPYIHTLRGIAILFIVASHCFAVFDWSGAPWSFRILDVVTTNGTVMFVFISGFLFQHLSDRFSVRRYLGAKLRYVILPYLVVSLPALAFRIGTRSGMNGLPEGIYDWNPVLQVLWFLGTGAHLGPLWFIPVIALFYLAAPALLWIDRRPALYGLLPLLLLAGSFVHRPEFNMQPLHAFLHLLPVYLAGMAFSRFRDPVQELLAPRLGWLLALWLALVAAHVLIVEHTGIIYVREVLGPDSLAVEWTYFQKLLLMALLIVGFRRYGSRVPHGWFDALAVNSFAVFFIHGYLTLTADRLVLWNGIVIPGSVPGFLVYVFLVTGLGILIARAVRLVAGRHSRLLVGS
ncbi:acyltransferase family protein [Rhodocista pekingensis]|uniref:Acyltransferase n=1 Tax=Rhodocista pekingensis TaxID=201185 RepID=A0ABW2KUQ3_9PROT